MSRLRSSVAVVSTALLFAAACSKAESRSSAPAPGLPPAPAETVAVPGADTVAVPGAAPTGAPPAAPAAPAAPSAPDSSFQLTVTPPAPGTAGAEAVAKVTIVPGTGYKMNKEYPTKLVVQPPEGVAVAKAEQQIGDASFDPHKLSFDIKLTAAKAGTYPVSGTIKFAVCTDQTCDPKKQTIAFDVVSR